MKNCRSKTNIRRNRDYVGRIAEIRKNIVTKTILKILVYNTTNGDDLFERWGGFKGRTVFPTLFLVPGQKSSTKNKICILYVLFSEPLSTDRRLNGAVV